MPEVFLSPLYKVTRIVFPPSMAVGLKNGTRNAWSWKFESKNDPKCRDGQKLISQPEFNWNCRWLTLSVGDCQCLWWLCGRHGQSINCWGLGFFSSLSLHPCSNSPTNSESYQASLQLMPSQLRIIRVNLSCLEPRALACKLPHPHVDNFLS